MSLSRFAVMRGREPDKKMWTIAVSFKTAFTSRNHLYWAAICSNNSPFICYICVKSAYRAPILFDNDIVWRKYSGLWACKVEMDPMDYPRP